MRASRVEAAEKALLDMSSPFWGQAETVKLELIPAPLGLQPSLWIQGAFAKTEYGKLSAATLRAVHGRGLIAVRADWAVSPPAASTTSPDEFADACAVMLPFVRDAPFMTMGADEQWVNMWLWRADGFGPLAVTAAGLGTTQRIDDGVVKAHGVYHAGAWHVIFVRALNPGRPRDHVPLELGAPWQINLALWHGANRERAGLKSIGVSWTELSLST